jgi:hypothetical protein
VSVVRCSLLAWTVDSDPARTGALYRVVDQGAAVRCGCADCRNFSQARPKHFPPPFGSLLESLAVDPQKEATVSLVTPLEGRRSLYSGSYLFCGSLLAGRPHRGFPFLRERVDVFEQIHPEAHIALRPGINSDHPWSSAECVRLEFLVVLPWVLAGERQHVIDLDRAARGDPPS